MSEQLYDDLVAAIRKEIKFADLATNLTIQFMGYDFDAIYANYALKIGKDTLTEMDKRQAFLDYLLEKSGE